MNAEKDIHTHTRVCPHVRAHSTAHVNCHRLAPSLLSIETFL